MNFAGIVFIAISLAMDCFTVSLGIGTTPIEKTLRRIFRLSFHFGLFQGGMTFLGWLAGNSIASLIEQYDHWIALLLLVFIGGRMIKESLQGKDEKELNCKDPCSGATLILLSIATSIDALAVGLSFAFLNVDIRLASLTIGLTSFILSIAGLKIGNRLGIRFGKRMEIIGGLILIAIGLNIVYNHLMI